jgi:hypothetical protein
MQIITDKGYLKSLVESLRKILEDSSDEKMTTIIGHRGGSYEYEVYYSRRLDIWFAFDDLPTRYWNAFGIGRPGRRAQIVVEINIPVEGRNRRIGGVFIRDDRGVWLGHRGTIGGGSRGVGYKAFWEHYKGRCSLCARQQGTSTHSPHRLYGFIKPPRENKQFVLEINRIKQLSKAVNP